MTPSFRDRLHATLRAIRPVLEVPGVLVVGSQVPNLLEPNAASTLVVSLDVDVAVPVSQCAAVKTALRRLRDFVQSSDEPSVYCATDPELLELNLLGMDPLMDDPESARVDGDPEVPLLVFGSLGRLRPGEPVHLGEPNAIDVPLPRLEDLLIEKLLTDRSGVKGDRDLLVAMGLLQLARPASLDGAIRSVRALRAEHRATVQGNLTLLSVLTPHANMPDPLAGRALVADLLRRIRAVS